ASAERDPLADAQADRIMIGQPSSWSAAVDALAAGLAIVATDEGMAYLDEEDGAEPRLFLLAAGKVFVGDFGEEYLARCDIEPILAEYPNLWPETVRALLVHSAEWTPAMSSRFDAAQGRQPRVALFRRYGMGVPDLARSIHSATDALTLVVEDVIHPFDGEGR